MRKSAITGAVGATLIAAAVSLTGCSSDADQPAAATSSAAMMSPQSMMSSPEMMSPQAQMSRTGQFGGLNGKAVSGMAMVSDDEIVLSGFSSDEGPDLHVYLTNGTDQTAVGAGKEIGTVAYDKDSQTFMLEGVDASSYTTVVINCDKAKAVFGAAPLMS
ncbi:DM13 domain-containing protein [Gordonia insulae]|uniref:DM13 domain-containing protein n=1 Tax=Gordonia insulae TaxID=2420509 RepID=A0A3G8JRJ5_9ACTN|nr:DM13 domain-containing protein [Gordonia insulae]AZG47553.1 hypothetical protein D7316_04164 [Gordonia insulae]